MNSLAEQWNFRFPERAVGKGHRLIKVNGIEDPAGIAAELRTALWCFERVAKKS